MGLDAGEVVITSAENLSGLLEDAGALDVWCRGPCWESFLGGCDGRVDGALGGGVDVRKRFRGGGIDGLERGGRGG